ncbi:unnamed protein product [Prorocentrum cordatum]|uniref:RRM domain-containing protein n=1 Tax=Prorocentrum cordatum TaxID=2364126 RepID=A0ABN9VY96_9DINO|nr:unnamed protein product [Polarella glacialis]
MAMAIALDLESAAYGGGKHVAGVSYDFKKAFDLIPIEIMLQAFNGIIQGDALSMIALNSIVSCILETSGTHAAAGITERSYADDISAVTAMETPEAAKEGVRRFHGVVRAFTGAGGGEINLKKCFTFGDDCARGVLGDEVRHFRQFGIVGDSFAVRESADAETELELQRLAKWKLTVGRIRHVPRSWRDRARMMQATQAQAFFAQGTHAMVADVAELREVRTAVMQALWKVDHYSLTPLVTFALLAPVQLDAEFGAVYEGLRAVMRAMRVPALATTLKERFGSVPTARRDGPTLRLRVLSRSGVFGPLVGRLLDGAVTDKQTEGEWLHDLRDAWRRALWQRLVKERGHQDGGAEDVDRVRTMILHDRLQEQASAEEEAQEEEAAEARAKLGVLWRILAGGLLTNERVGRHKKEGSLACACGAPEATVEHVTWECSQYEPARQRLLAELPRITFLALCTRYAGIIPASSPLTQRQSVLLQTFMLTVWRDQVQRWHRGDDLLQVAEPEAPAPAGQEGAAAAAQQGHAENGHHLERRVGADGLWCRKCGKFVQRTQHVRLKITGRRCEFPDLPPERWLQREGQRQAESRLDQLWRDTEERYNKGGHVLTWNRRTGKVAGAADEGWIECTACGSKWRWAYRCNNLPRTQCAALGAGVAKFVTEGIAKIVEVPQVGNVEDILHSPKALTEEVEEIMEVPQAEYVEKIVHVPMGVTDEVEEIMEVPQEGHVENIAQLPKAVTAEVVKIVEVPQVEDVEKIVHVPKADTHEVEKIVELPHSKYDEKIAEVPKRVTAEVEKIVEVPQVEIVNVPKDVTEVEKLVEVRQVAHVEEIVHVPKAMTHEVEKIVKAPQSEYVEKIVEVPKGFTGEVVKIVEVPQVKYDDRVPKNMTEEVEKIVEAPQAEYVQKVVHVPMAATEEVKKILVMPQVECAHKIVHVPKAVTHGIERSVEAPQVEHVEKIVEVPKVVTQVVETIVEVPQVEYVEKAVHVPEVTTYEVEKVVEAPQVEYVGKIVEVPKRATEGVEKTVEVPQVEIVHVPNAEVKKSVDVLQVAHGEETVHVPKAMIHSGEKILKVPQGEYVEKIVEVPKDVEMQIQDQVDDEAEEVQDVKIEADEEAAPSEEARLKAEEEEEAVKLQAQEEDRLKAEAEEETREAEEARLKAEEVEEEEEEEEAAKVKAAEEARLKAKAEEEARKAEEAWLKAEEEEATKLKAAEEARLKAEAEEQAAPSAEAEEEEEKRKGSNRHIYVENLDMSIDNNKALFDTFSLFGSIVSCYVASSPQGKSYGFGFVYYETEKAAQQAVERVNGMQIGEKTVLVSHLVMRPSATQPSQPSACSSDPHGSPPALGTQMRPRWDGMGSDDSASTVSGGPFPGWLTENRFAPLAYGVQGGP